MQKRFPGSQAPAKFLGFRVQNGITYREYRLTEDLPDETGQVQYTSGSVVSEYTLRIFSYSLPPEISAWR